MQILRQEENIVLMTNVEEWMADQQYTEVFNFSTAPVTADEMAITRILDELVGKVLNYIPNIDQTVAGLNRGSEPIKGRRAEEGEQSLGSKLGQTYDRMFKEAVDKELRSGDLKAYSQRLVVIPHSKKGPDIYMISGCMIAWDLTSRGDIKKHIKRDVYERGYHRYYLLIWDEPRTEPAKLVRKILRNQASPDF